MSRRRPIGSHVIALERFKPPPYVPELHVTIKEWRRQVHHTRIHHLRLRDLREQLERRIRSLRAVDIVDLLLLLPDLLVARAHSRHWWLVRDECPDEIGMHQEELQGDYTAGGIPYDRGGGAGWGGVFFDEGGGVLGVTFEAFAVVLWAGDVAAGEVPT